MPQHFLLTAAARSLSLAQVARMSDEEARDIFQRIRWSETAGEPVCPECGCLDVYAYVCRPLWRCKGCRRQFSLQISEFPTGDFGSNRQAVSVETDRPFRSKSAPRCGWVLVPTLANRRCVIHPILLWSAKASTLVIIIVSSDCCGRL